MTTAGPTRPSFGTRFELVLDDAQPDGARYRCAVFRSDEAWSATLEIHGAEPRLIERSETLPDDALAQLLALARVLAKRASDEPWPRRVLRWRQPGVR